MMAPSYVVGFFILSAVAGYLVGASFAGGRRELRMRELDIDEQEHQFRLHVFQSALPILHAVLERRRVDDTIPPPSTGFARAVAGLQHAVHDFELCNRCSDTAGMHMQPTDVVDVPRQWSPEADMPCRTPGCHCVGFAQAGLRA